MQRLLDALLTTQPVQRVRLAQAGLAMLMLTAGVLAMQYSVFAGMAQAVPVALWSALSVGGMVVFFLLIRFGWSRQFADPSLTVPQMVYALLCGAVAYALVGPGRGGVFPIVMVVLMFGMFVVTPAQMRAVGLFAVALFGTVMALMAWRDPATYPPSVELGHFLMVATMMPAVAVLAARLSRMRARASGQREELSMALERIRELATRDELTGLINRRHMQELLSQEHQRCIRSGQTFCLAVLDIDGFRAVNERHGSAAGDVALRTVAQEAQRHVRVSDVLSRWGGEEFVLLMSDTRSVLARGGLERLNSRVAALRLVLGAEGGAPSTVSVTLSSGLAEHIAGESVTQTLERAERALLDAKARGRGQVALAA
jgi:diguanylate cyclase